MSAMTDGLGAGKLGARRGSWRSALMSWWCWNRMDRQEDSCDRHRRAAMPTDERWRSWLGNLRRCHRRWHMQQCARQRQIGLASGVCKDPVVPDPVETCGQDMQQEAAHELARVERHRLAHRVLGAVVLPAKRHTTFIHGHQTPF